MNTRFDLSPKGNLAELSRDHRDYIDAHKTYCKIKYDIRAKKLTNSQARTIVKNMPEPQKTYINEIRELMRK